jgi:hypothetical protein
MADEEWIKKLEDGRKVKFIYLGLPDGGAFITAQLAGNEVVYSIILTKARNPLLKVISRASFKRSSDTQFVILSAEPPIQTAPPPVKH